MVKLIETQFIADETIFRDTQNQSWLLDGIFLGTRITISRSPDWDFSFWVRPKNLENREISGIGTEIRKSQNIPSSKSRCSQYPGDRDTGI